MSLDKLKETLKEFVLSNIKVQTCWVTCKEVQADENTMTCIGSGDGLEFYDVLLGLGSIIIQPKAGSKCLIGIIENKEAAAFLIWCDEADLIQFNGGENNGIPLSEPLKTKLNTLENDLNSLKQIFTSWIVSPSDGGAALKTAAASWYSQSLQETTLSDIQNTKITQ